MRNPAYRQWLPAPRSVRVTLIAKRLAPPAPVDIQYTSVSELSSVSELRGLAGFRSGRHAF